MNANLNPIQLGGSGVELSAQPDPEPVILVV